MKLREIFLKRKNSFELKDVSGQISGQGETGGKPEVPEGLLKRCNACKAAVFTEEVRKNYYICPRCHNYFRVHAYCRIRMLADEGSFEEWDAEMPVGNPLQYKGYEEKLGKLQEKTGLNEAVVTGKVRIGGREAVLGVCDGRFMMASMGHVVGEKIVRAAERATQMKLPLILFTCSGGARMQEGMISLMQMAKTSAALKRHSDAGLLYITVLTDPTTGGVTASFGMLGDIILAEPNALIGFAGPRVIEQTIGQKLPKGFQRAEFLLEHGFIDRIVEREELKETLTELLKLHTAKGKAGKGGTCEASKKQVYAVNRKISPWERVQVSRMQDRPVGSDYLKGLFTGFLELHGDRCFGDDPAIIGGLAWFHGMPVTVIAQEKGSTTKERMKRNFGMPYPEGYRKALRLMKQAEKFHRPVICFVDTPGAFCGLEAEERGQGEAIARSQFELSTLDTSVLSIVIGEGGSGGALALAAGDQVWMLENAVYSILSPEGFASILWKDSKKAADAAAVMKLTAEDLKILGVIERVIQEPEHLTRMNLSEVLLRLEHGIEDFLEQYGTMKEEERRKRRYERFRKF